METTERIVEAYCRYIKHWFTIPNIRVRNNEIDLIAVDKDGNKAHIEIGVSISGGFSKLRNIAYQTGEEKNRLRQAAARTKLGYFENKKFGSPEIVKELRDSYGFDARSYKKIIVAWSAEEEAVAEAKAKGIEVWLLPQLIAEIEGQFGKESGYYRDDTIRTLHLAAKTTNLQKKQELERDAKRPKLVSKDRGVPTKAWMLFVSKLPKNVPSITYPISQISKDINYNLESEKSPTIYNQYWQSKHAHTDMWRAAGWRAEPKRDPKSRRIVAVRFIKLAQRKFI